MDEGIQRTADFYREQTAIWLTIPTIEEDDLNAVRDVLTSGHLVQVTRFVDTFELNVADYVGTKHAVAVSNCTSALLLALMALDVNTGDVVAVTTYSWPATANVIALCGAKPVFVEIDARTFNMNPDLLAALVKRTKVKAVLPVHTFGGMADMESICAIATEQGVPVVEDAACALGRNSKGKDAGTWGVMECFSFHPRKAITTGEGGVVTTNDSALARRLRYLCNHGQDPDAPSPDFVAAGHNMRLTEFQASLGSTQMNKITRIIDSRRAQAALYDKLLKGTDITTPAVSLARAMFFSRMWSSCLQAPRARRELIGLLEDQGIETTIGTYHMPLTTYFRTYDGFGGRGFPRHR